MSAFHPLRTLGLHASVSPCLVWSFFVNWLWPQHLNPDDRVAIRIGRLLHWSILGFAVFELVVSLIGLIEAGDGEPIGYFSIAFLWVAFAMLGRGLRYVVAHE
jgi:hypothetical protein